MKKLLLLSVAMLSFVGCASAMNIETGKEFSDDRDQTTGKLLKGKSATGQRCKTWISEASIQLQKLLDLIENEHKNEMTRKYISKDTHDKHTQKVASDIKNTLNEIREKLNNAEKELDFSGY